MSVWYATREDVKSAPDYKATARANAAVDDAIEAASRAVEDLTHRKFYPEIDTRYFDWPTRQTTSTRIWLNEDELLAATAVVSGGVTLTASEYFLGPANTLPYNRIEVNLGESGSFTVADTPQRSMAITGTYGYPTGLSSAGGITVAMNASVTAVDVSDSGAIGVGSVLLVDSEHMIVTDKLSVDTTVDIGGNLTAALNNETVPVADGTAFSVGEQLLIGAEQMLIVDIGGNNLVVKRAYDGSTLATHTTGDSIYAKRRLTVERGSLGTTAASHLDNAAISTLTFAGLCRALCVAEALVELNARTGMYISDTKLAAIEDLRNKVRNGPLTRRARLR